MKTIYLPCEGEGLRLGAELLSRGELVVMPTETVYGLAADAADPKAVERIFTVKGRPQDNPLIVHISGLSMWEPLVESVPEGARRLAEAFWPGPLTIILKKSGRVPSVTTAGMDSVAVRMPAHPGALGLIEACGFPLAAPSANLSGLPSPTTAEHCRRDLDGKVPLVLDGGECRYGIESTVLSLTGTPTLLRPGAVTAGQIAEVLGEEPKLFHALTEPLAKGERPLSPGMKYRHYAPRARVVLVEGPREGFLRLLESAPQGTWGMVFEGDQARTDRPTLVYGRAHDADSQAHGVFAALRRLDDEGAKLVYVRCPDHYDAALGVYNRLLRAAGFEVIKV